MVELLQLFIGTLVLRPYVFVFLSVYCVASAVHLGWKRTLVFIPVGYALAWISEYSSIHWGIPYGEYYYLPTTEGHELWVLGVPFMDSLSYVFLAYCSFSVASFLRSPLLLVGKKLFVLETRAVRRSFGTLFLGALLFVLLDIIIDPVTLQGHRWFLGQIYGYRQTGYYFGIPISNFMGWLLVGLIMIGTLQILDRIPSLDSKHNPFLGRVPNLRILGVILYLGILTFNLVITFWIGEILLGIVGSIIVFYSILVAIFFTHFKINHLRPQDISAYMEDAPFPELPFPIPEDLRLNEIPK